MSILRLKLFVRSSAIAVCLGIALLPAAQVALGQGTPSAPAAQSAQSSPPSAVPVQSTPEATPGTMAPKSATSAIPELSAWSMFLSADLLVKAVMLSLVFASFVNFTILIYKTIELAVANRKVRASLDRMSPSRSLHEAQLALGTNGGIVGAFVAAAVREVKLSADTPVEAGIKERVASSLSEIVRAEGRAVRVGMGVLATIGSTSPFVGLFGTVWGIMNSFIGISKSQTTNLAVVAPGIAEALLATACGLVAAIPAVIIYNHFTRGTRGYLDQVNRASGAVMRLLSRDLDRSQGRLMGRAAE